jgi:pSer/pThr/pTyr-binding forkhead associated (FHA) protein
MSQKQTSTSATLTWSWRSQVSSRSRVVFVRIVSNTNACVHRVTDEQTIIVTDKSSNGTLINGEKMKKGVPRKILCSDVISLALTNDQSSFRIDLQDGSTTPTLQSDDGGLRGEGAHLGARSGGVDRATGAEPADSARRATLLLEEPAADASGVEAVAKAGKEPAAAVGGSVGGSAQAAVKAAGAAGPSRQNLRAATTTKAGGKAKKTGDNTRNADSVSRSRASASPSSPVKAGEGKRRAADSASAAEPARDAESGQTHKRARRNLSEDQPVVEPKAAAGSADKAGKSGPTSSKAAKASGAKLDTKKDLGKGAVSDEPPRKLRESRGGGVNRWAPLPEEPKVEKKGKGPEPKSAVPKTPKSKSKPEVYIIDQILKKETKKGVVRFLVSWEGYGPEGNTWEPEEQLLQDVPKLVKAFEKKR